VDRPPVVDNTDAELAARARDGDRESYRTLVVRYQTLAFRTAYLVTRSAQDAEDAAQDGFVKAFLKLDQFEPGAQFRPWLLTIDTNEARNRVRAEARRLVYETISGRHIESDGSTPSPEASAIASDDSENLVDAVNALPEGERLVVGLRYFLELSEAETAAAAGVPAGTVKSRLSRAMGKLRKTIGGDDA
jgi:RNA polymerase sigma-70 factor (ECF subfamily)